jgi:hypothetical protein
MSTSTNYSNRTIDLWLGGDPTAQFERISITNQSFGLEDQGGGAVCTGFMKLVQKALVLLLTYMYHYDPYWGTDFGNILFAGSVQNAVAALNLIRASATARVVTLLRNEETEGTPYDERIASFIITDISSDLDSGSVSVTLVIRNVAGDTTTYVLPVNVIP